MNAKQIRWLAALTILLFGWIGWARAAAHLGSPASLNRTACKRLKLSFL